MSDFIPALAAIIVSCLLMTLGFGFLPCVSEKKQLYFKSSIIFGAVMTVSALILSVLLPNVTHMEAAPSPLTAAAVTVCGFCSLVLSRYIPDGALKKFAKRTGKAALVIFFVEAFICNFNRFTLDNKPLTQPVLSEAEKGDKDSVQIKDDSIVMIGSSSVSFDLGTEENVRAVSLKFEGDDKWIKASVDMTDENFRCKPVTVGTKFFSGSYDRPLWFGIDPYKKLNTLTVSLSELQGQAALTAIELDCVMPYYFSDIRFFVLLLITALILAIVTFGFYKVEYDHKKTRHNIAMYITAALCSASMLMFLVPEEQGNTPIEYDSITDIENSDPYLQMFDSLMKGQLSLDIEPSESLTKLNDPYDNSVRKKTNTSFKWDRAYYNGKYYSYYPIIPVLLFYCPYYILTGGLLPTINTATVFFAMIGVLFMTGALLALVKRFNKHPNFLLLILSVIACTAAGGYYLGSNYSNLYSLPAVVSTAFLMLCIWCGVSACNTLESDGGGKLSYGLFALSGLAFVLCLSARPTKSISALILAPLFIAVLIRKKRPVKTKAASAVSFLAPVTVGIAAIAAYNYVRFGSLLEFGQSYQLTVSNIQANHLDASLLPNSFIHYFMQPISFSGDFPYIDMSTAAIHISGKYMYEARNFGVFSFPLILLGTLSMPFFVWHTRHRKTACAYTYNNNRIRNYTYVLMFVLMIIVAFMDYCIGGAIAAYTLDILPVMLFMSVLVLMSIQEHMKKYPVPEGKTVCALSLVSVATIVISFMIVLTVRDYRKLLDHFPDLFSELERLICFWH